MIRIVIVLSVVALSIGLSQCTNSNAKAPAGQVIQTYQLRLQEFSRAADALLHSLQQQPPSYWQQAFQKTRLAYKVLELMTDYYFPGTAKAINGPPVTEVEPDEPEKEIEPTGFQVMEEWLFPQPDTTAQEELVAQARILQSLSQRLQNGLASLRLSDSHVMDAIRLHLLRISSMGLAGADNGIAQNSIAEAVVGLQSMGTFLLPYEPQPALVQLLNKAVAFLKTDTSFSTFNRATFLVQFAKPLWHQLKMTTAAWKVVRW